MLYVGLRAFQSRNIVHGHYGITIPFSYAIDIVGFYIIAQIAKEGYNFPLILCIGTGSSLGTLIAMFLHERLYKDNNKHV